jgi:hypothetical protein
MGAMFPWDLARFILLTIFQMPGCLVLHYFKTRQIPMKVEAIPKTFDHEQKQPEGVSTRPERISRKHKRISMKSKNRPKESGTILKVHVMKRLT